jgi:hypothetical protein
MGYRLHVVSQIIDRCNIMFVIHMYSYMFGSKRPNGNGVDYARMRMHGIEGHDCNLL